MMLQAHRLGAREWEPDTVVLGGRFRIVRTLGAGGMGVVYVAEQVSLGRNVALKVLHPRVNAQPDMAERFKSEARLLSSVDHPGVVRVIDYGREGEVGVLVMELAEGQTLEKVLKRQGKFEVARAVPLLIQLAEGLGAIHAAGIVHRDIKAENVMLGRGASGETARLVDFGVARLVDAAAGPQTHSHKVEATLAYMSPERATGSPPDPRSDLYSFGVLAFRMLTGKLPFPGPSLAEFIDQHTNLAPPRPETFVPELASHRALSAVVMCLLEKESRKRFFSARALAEALRRLSDTERSITPFELQALLPSESLVIDDLPPEDAPQAAAPEGATIPPVDLEEELKTAAERIPEGALEEDAAAAETQAQAQVKAEGEAQATRATVDGAQLASRARVAASGAKRAAVFAKRASRDGFKRFLAQSHQTGRTVAGGLERTLRALRARMRQGFAIPAPVYWALWLSLAVALVTVVVVSRMEAPTLAATVQEKLKLGDPAGALALLDAKGAVADSESKLLRVHVLHALKRHDEEHAALAALETASLDGLPDETLAALAADFARNEKSEVLREQLARIPRERLEAVFGALAIRPASQSQWGALRYLDAVAEGSGVDRALGYTLALGHSHCALRNIALARLTEAGDLRAVPALTALLETEQEPGEPDCGRRAAKAALEAIQKRGAQP